MSSQARNEAIQYVTELVVDMMAELSADPYAVPVGISARHVHLTRHDAEVLFGQGYELTFLKKLSQPGQFAAAETVEIAGPKGTIKKVRILGPERSASQVEVACSDSRTLGISPPVRTSGDLTGTPGIRIKGPAGEVKLESGLIIADRHVHMTPADAKWYGVKDGDRIRAVIDGDKAGVMGNVTVRVSDSYRLDFHIDTDDANAFQLKQGQKVTLEKPGL